MAKVSPVCGCLQKRLHQWEGWGQGPGPQCWEETAGAQGREPGGGAGGTWPRGFLNWFHSFWGRGHFWGFRGESLTLCLHTSALPSHPPSPALAKFGTTLGYLRGPCPDDWAAGQVWRDLETRRWKGRSCPVLPHLVPWGPSVGWKGAGAWGMEGAAWRGLELPS